MAIENGKDSARRTLSSWKEIAAFLGRNERTVKRWEESRGLPVRRIPGAGRSSIFAYTDEIEAWMRTGAQSDSSSPVQLLEASEPETSSRRPWLHIATIAGLAGAAILAAGVIFFNFGASPLFGTRQQNTHSADPAAAEYYRSGLHAWQTRSPAGLARAIADFNRAVGRDPHFAVAYAGLADAYNLEAEFTTIPPTDTYPRAVDAAKRAIDIDPSLGSAHAALAFADFYWSRDAAAAEREFRRAIALDPANATAHHWYATFLMTMNRQAEALSQIDRAQSLDSESNAIPADKALILFHAGKIDQAVKLLTQIEDEQPDFASPHSYLATIWFDENDDSAYLRELELAARARRDTTEADIAEAGAKGLASAGHIGMLHAILETQRDDYRVGKETAYALAITSAKLGDTDGAIAYLSASVARHEAGNSALAIEPAFAPLRSDSRFIALLARTGLNARG